MSTDDLATTDIDSSVRVQVTPSQSSYFAGEPFSVTITFTNTRTPESPGPKSRNTHKRGAHSISSAPLARPPTSPGIPRPAPPPPFLRTLSNDRDKPVRKGLIGQDTAIKSGNGVSGLLEQKRQILLEKSRSLSVDIPPHELQGNGVNSSKDESPLYVRAYQEFSDTEIAAAISPHAPSPSTLTRMSSLPSKHPHARKQSVFDGQIQLHEVQQTSTPSAMPSSSTSTFSLALDPIAETPQTPYPGSPLPRSPSLTDSLDTRASIKTEAHSYPPRPSQNPHPPRRPSQLGLGHGPPPGLPQPSTNGPPRTAFGTSFPQSNTELILYSYAQLLGTLSVSPLPGAIMSPDQARTLGALRGRLLKRPIIGGGSMDITSSLHSRQQLLSRRRSHSRSASLTSGLFSLLSPSTYSPSSTPLPASQSWSTSQRSRTPSQSSLTSPVQSLASSTNGVGLGLIDGGADDDVDPEAPLPTFEVQPAMLAVDLSLAPGESRSYTYSVLLPDNLHPRSKFSYELCRSSSLGPTGANSISRVMKVPIRVYNNVSVGRLQRPYDLLWPVATRRNLPEAAPKVLDFKATNGAMKIPPSSCAYTLRSEIKAWGSFGDQANNLCTASSTISSGSLDDLRDYGQRLLATFPDPDATGVRIKVPAEAVSPAQNDLERGREGDGGALTGCREAVELLTRNPKKVSYDVNKDGVKVAVLTFTKSAYRLGETVLGVVELNDRSSRSRVLSLSAMLEAQESLPSLLSSAGNVRHMRRVHAEHYSSFVSSSLRTTFSLDIPSDASPAFQVQIGESNTKSPSTPGGLVWRVRLCLLVAVAAESSQAGSDGVRLKQLVRDGPKGDWGTSWKASTGIAPLERPQLAANGKSQEPSTWAHFFVSSFLGGAGEKEYHDGDEDVDGEELWQDPGDGEDEWKEVKVETVECEVPINVWPGNTAFKAMDVVFDV
ncbi:Rgp1-domain-containing protein [Leucogyrophana mollusca]|uniref:Rgp1-domain-containing protein n=1 Tax=Leucogyrophana mollusca TaxID=85980 RepID=A0ACB8BDG6_9AGAM|nr:Rgp1-domain-containing protein [Leucogyrophana mollusca]